MAPLLISSTLLVLFGIFNLIGTKVHLAPVQGAFFAVSLLLFFLIRRIGLHFFRSNAKSIYWIFVAILIVTFIIGFEAKGSKRWIDFGLFNFQPSEFFKIFFVIFLADFFVRTRNAAEHAGVFIGALMYFAIPAFIIFSQPDLGSALVYAAIFVTMLLMSKIPGRLLLIGFGAALILAIPGWSLLKDYQKARIVTFVNPSQDVLGRGYNRTQAVIAAGSGRFFGKGLGKGTQSTLLFLPENHTDFAYSSLVEQFGFFGGGIVLFLYGFILTHLYFKFIRYRQGQSEGDYFRSLFCAGFFAFFFFQVSVNILMNLGIFPIAGITLPFISYGGSSLASLSIGIALLSEV